MPLQVSPRSNLSLTGVGGADKDLSIGEGARKSVDFTRSFGNKKLEKFLNSPLGGRQCELVGLQTRSDLNSSTCVISKYLPDVDTYIVKMEICSLKMENVSQEAIKVKSANLKRRDKTAEDCGAQFLYNSERSRAVMHQAVLSLISNNSL